MNVEDNRKNEEEMLYAKDVPAGRVFEFVGGSPDGLRFKLEDDDYIVLDGGGTPGHVQHARHMTNMPVRIIPEDKIRIVIDA